jgi:hypothetical protein
MGTRSNTVIVDSGTKILNLYRQMDGYPSGHGAELAAFLSVIKLVNGYGLDQKEGTFANGMGCLAAQLVAHFKTGIGGFYIENPNGECDNDYTYTIGRDGGPLKITVDEYGKRIFDGSVTKFVKFCKDER